MTYLPKPYVITAVEVFTSDVKLFKVKCAMDPQPGQFIEVSVPGVGECPLASCSFDGKYVDILVRNAGNVTTALFDLKKKDALFIRGPYGKGFPLAQLKKKNLIMIAGGTGIAPVTSLIEYVEKHRREFKEVFIYFGFRDEAHVLLSDRIEKWKKKFHVHVGLSNDVLTHKYERGYVQEIMEKHKPKVEHTVALLCGPETMMGGVTLELNRLGLTDNKICWSMERRMECGFGSCGRCQIQDLYVCKDGPIFRYDVIKPRLENEQSSEGVKK